MLGSEEVTDAYLQLDVVSAECELAHAIAPMAAFIRRRCRRGRARKAALKELEAWANGVLDSPLFGAATKDQQMSTMYALHDAVGCVGSSVPAANQQKAVGLIADLFDIQKAPRKGERVDLRDLTARMARQQKLARLRGSTGA